MKKGDGERGFMKKNKLVVIERRIKTNRIVAKWEFEFDSIERTIDMINELEKNFSRNFVKFEYRIIEVR